jgi:hypothetical protein
MAETGGHGRRTARLLAAIRRATADRHDDAVRVLGPGEDADDRSCGGSSCPRRL